MPNTFSVSLILLILFPRVVAGSIPGLEFANAFGVFEKQFGCGSAALFSAGLRFISPQRR